MSIVFLNEVRWSNWRLGALKLKGMSDIRSDKYIDNICGRDNHVDVVMNGDVLHFYIRFLEYKCKKSAGWLCNGEKILSMMVRDAVDVACQINRLERCWEYYFSSSSNGQEQVRRTEAVKSSGIRSTKMKNIVSRFAKDESGATAIEYGLIAGLIAIAIIGAATTLGTQLAAMFGRISATLRTAVPG